MMGSGGRESSLVSVIPARTPIIPDWSVVTTPRVRKAVEDILVAGRWDWRLEGIDPQSARVLATVLRLYAEVGRPPALSELAGKTAMSDTELSALLDRLARHDLLLLEPDRTSISGAYPFTEKVTGHAVAFERTGKRLNTMCAIDALGAGAMCREDVCVHSLCRFCNEEILARTEDRGATLRDVIPTHAVVWIGLQQSRGCAADTLCAELLLFCSDEHLIRWRSPDRGMKGHVLTAQEGFEVGKALFTDRAMAGSDRA